jgi:hypothetical protein
VAAMTWPRIKVRTLLVAIAFAALVMALIVQARAYCRLKARYQAEVAAINRGWQTMHQRDLIQLWSAEESNRRLRYQREIMGLPHLDSPILARRPARPRPR